MSVVGTGLNPPEFRYATRVASIIETAPGGAFVLEVVVSLALFLDALYVVKSEHRV